MLHTVIHDETNRAAAPEGIESLDVPARARVRSCVGCGERVDLGGASAGALRRLVVGPTGDVAAGLFGSEPGRGAHVHPRPACVGRAVERGLARAAKRKVERVRLGFAPSATFVPLSVASLAQALMEAETLDLVHLLMTAVRAKQVVAGAAALADHPEAIAVVARDAGEDALTADLRRAIELGRAVAWGTKAQLGALVGVDAAGADGVAVLTVLSPALAIGVRAAVHAVDGLAAAVAAPPTRAGSRGRGKTSPDTSSKASACAPPAEGGQLRPAQGATGVRAASPRARTGEVRPGHAPNVRRAPRGRHRES